MQCAHCGGKRFRIAVDHTFVIDFEKEPPVFTDEGMKEVNGFAAPLCLSCYEEVTREDGEEGLSRAMS